jgi:hypothetical protein
LQGNDKTLHGTEERKIAQVDEAVLCFVSEACSKRIVHHRPSDAVEGKEIAKTFGIDETKFKATKVWCDRFMC